MEHVFAVLGSGEVQARVRPEPRAAVVVAHGQMKHGKPIRGKHRPRSFDLHLVHRLVDGMHLRRGVEHGNPLAPETLEAHVCVGLIGHPVDLDQLVAGHQVIVVVQACQ